MSNNNNSGGSNLNTPTSSIPRSQSYNQLGSLQQQQQQQTTNTWLSPNTNNFLNIPQPTTPNNPHRVLQHSHSSISPLTTSNIDLLSSPLHANTTTPSLQPQQSTPSLQQTNQSLPTTGLIQPQQPNQSLPGDENTLKRLIKIGNWTNVFKVADLCIANSNNPLSILQYKLCRVIAHVKMRNYKVAYDEIQGIGDIRDLVNCFEGHHNLFPGKKGTMVPFSMRVIKAELACHLGVEKYQLDALYALLSICKREILNIEQQQYHHQQQQQQQQNILNSSTISVDLNKSIISPTNQNQNNTSTTPTTPTTNIDNQSKQQEQSQLFLTQLETSTILTPTNLNSPAMPSSPSIPSTPVSVSTMNQLSVSVNIDEIFDPSFDLLNNYNNSLIIWKSRERRIIFSIITFLVQKNKDYLLAIKILEDLIARQQPDQWLLSALGRLYLQLGAVSQSDAIFKLTDKLITHNGGSLDTSILSIMNKGFLAIASDQYPLAIQHFDKILSMDPINICAANNKCISLLYTCDLSGAVQTIELLMAKEKEKTIDETLVFNICSLYELSSEKSLEKKKSIMTQVAKYAADNFDLKVFKIN